MGPLFATYFEYTAELEKEIGGIDGAKAIWNSTRGNWLDKLKAVGQAAVDRLRSKRPQTAAPAHATTRMAVAGDCNKVLQTKPQ